MTVKSHIIGRRGELIAELFLQELNPSFVAKPTSDFGYDFFVGFPNIHGGVNNYAVRVQATERPVGSRFPIDKNTCHLLAHSNIPALLVVVDVKQNRLFYAWLTPEISQGDDGAQKVGIPVMEVDDSAKEALRGELTGFSVKAETNATRTPAEA